jgi:hypothetical protein
MLKTFDVPETISLSQVTAFLAEIGVNIRPQDLIEFHIGMDGVHVEVYDTDADGRLYFNPDGKSLATHRIAIRLDQTV